MIHILEEKKNILFIFCATAFFILSMILYWLAPSSAAHLDLDSPGYDRVAYNFATAGKLIDPSMPHDMPIQMVGYPFFVGILYFFFGHSYFMVVLAQVLLMLLSGWLLYKCADQLFGKSVAAIALILATFNIGFLTFSQFILTETFLVTLLMIWFYYFVQLQQRPEKIIAAKASLILGLSAVVKPIALFFFPLICLWMMIFLQCSKLCRAKVLCVSLVFFYIPVIGYMSYNKVMHNHFIVAPLMKESLYYYFLFRVVARVENITIEEAVTKTRLLLNKKDNHSELRWEGTKNLLNVYIQTHPISVLFVWLENTTKTIGGLFSTQLKILLNPALKGGKNSFSTCSGNWLQRVYNYAVQGADHSFLKTVAVYEILWNIIRWLLFVYGISLFWTQRRYDIFSFFVITILFFVLITGHEGCARFRLPIEPFLIVVASFALLNIYSFYAKREHALRLIFG